jgi:hypothetical protein
MPHTSKSRYGRCSCCVVAMQAHLRVVPEPDQTRGARLCAVKYATPEIWASGYSSATDSYVSGSSRSF